MSSIISSSITNYDSDNNEEESSHHVVPPPPPHIELLKLTTTTNNNANNNNNCHTTTITGKQQRHYYCVTHVISYLDNGSRNNAAISCGYLRDAVCDYYSAASKSKEAAKATTVAAYNNETALLQLQEAHHHHQPNKVDDERNKHQPTTTVVVGSPRRVSEFPSSSSSSSEEVVPPVVVAADNNDQDNVEFQRLVAAEELPNNKSSAASTTTTTEDEDIITEAAVDEKAEKEGLQFLAVAQVAALRAELDYIERSKEEEKASEEPMENNKNVVEKKKQQRRNILEEMDHLEEAIPQLRSPSSVVMMSASSLDGEKKDTCYENDEEEEEEEEMEQEELLEHNVEELQHDEELVSTSSTMMGTTTNTQKKNDRMFLSQLNSSGLLQQSLSISFISSNKSSSIPEEEEEEEEEDQYNESSSLLLPAVLSYTSNNAISSMPSSSPIASPMSTISTPDISLTGATTRLELGSTCHILGDGSKLPILGRVNHQHVVDDGESGRRRQQKQRCYSSSSSVLTDEGKEEEEAGGSNNNVEAITSANNSGTDMQQITLGGSSSTKEKEEEVPKAAAIIKQQQPLAHFTPHPKFSNNTNTSTSAYTAAPSFTRLRDLHNGTSAAAAPFDEEVVLPISQSMSSLSASYHSSLRSDSPFFDDDATLESDASIASLGMLAKVKELHQSTASDSSSTEDTNAADVLAQFSDAALFGDTPKIFTDILTEIMDSAKHAVSHLQTNLNTGNKRNEIDDSGPIKIGDKYYSHNEALQLWRKAKVKLEDRYDAIDGETGNVLLERATFFEKNSVFREKEKKKQLLPKNTVNGGTTTGIITEGDDIHKKKTKSKAQLREEQGAVSINELLKHTENSSFLLKLREIQRKKSVDESTAVAGNGEKNDIMDVGQNYESVDENVNAGLQQKQKQQQEEERKPSLLSLVDESEDEESKATTADNDESAHQEEMSSLLEVDGNETADTEDETKSVDGSADRLSNAIDSETTSQASNISGANNNDIKMENVDLKEGILLLRNRGVVAASTPTIAQAVATSTPAIQAGGGSTSMVPVQTNDSNAPKTETNDVHTNDDHNAYKQETESVAGRDSLPSDMGSMYGVEVSSLRGMNCNFIKGKSSEQVKVMAGEKSVRKGDCEQSVLGSQYGTEVLFKPKMKVATARKPRTLAGHNMGVKAVKQTMGGGVNAVKQNVNVGGVKGTTTTATMKQKSVKFAKQNNVGVRSGKQNNMNSGNKVASSSSKQQRIAAPSLKTANQPRVTKMQKKPSLPLKKLKLGIKKTTRS